MCTGARLDCAEEITASPEDCLIPCTGLYANVRKTGPDQIEPSGQYGTLLREYETYKRFNVTNSKVLLYNPGETFTCCRRLLYVVAEYKKFKTTLQFIRIYFDTIIFDKITKDSRVKFSDMLAGVGGTMGLLTGFSIISGMEILYFMGKIILDTFHKQ